MGSRLSVKTEQMVLEMLRKKLKTDSDTIQAHELYVELGGRAKTGYAFASFHQMIRASRIAGAFPGFTCRQRYGWTKDDGREADRLDKLSQSATNLTGAERRRKEKQRIQDEVFQDILAAKTAAQGEVTPPALPAAPPPPPPVQEVLVAQPVMAVPTQGAFPLEIQTLMERENAGFSIKMAEMATQFMQGMVDAMKEHADNMRMLMLTAKQMDG